LAGALAVGVVSACLGLLLLRMTCRRCCRERHRHVQLKDVEESGMPPQIVGGAADDGGFDAFVIGDDENDHLSADGFEYVDDATSVTASLAGTSRAFSGAQMRPSQTPTESSDLLDLAFGDPRPSTTGQGANSFNLRDGPLI